MRPVLACLTVAGLLAGAGASPADEVTKKDVPRLLKALKGSSSKEKIAAADGLGKLGAVYAPDARPAAPLLINLLKKDKDAGVREAAARALGRIDPEPKEAVPVLKDALKDKAVGVRMAVNVPGLDKAQVQALVDAAHQVCPYSNATRGNIDVAFTIV